MIGFNITNPCFRKSNMFHISFHIHNYSSASFFHRTLSSANRMADNINFFYVTAIIIKQSSTLMTDRQYKMHMRGKAKKIPKHKQGKNVSNLKGFSKVPLLR